MIHFTLHTYKDWMGRYIDGTLSETDMHSADQFLKNHPEILDAYLAGLDDISLIPDETAMPDKENLTIRIKSTASINSGNYTEFFVASYENELTPELNRELTDFLTLNPELKKEFNVYSLTHLQTPLITYPYKKELLKNTRTIVPLFWSISAAASVILIISIYLGIMNSETTVQKKSLGLTSPSQIMIPEAEDKVGFNKQNTFKISGDKNNSLTLAYSPKSTNTTALNSKKHSRTSSESVRTERLHTINIHSADNNQIALKQIPDVYLFPTIENDPVVDSKPERKGIFNKIVSGEKIYIEDYVNATFSAFNDDEKNDSKWVLKVDRDKNGKSKKIKFSSPLFSIKTND